MEKKELMKEKVRAATGKGMLRICFNLYNQLCIGCRANLFRAARMSSRTNVEMGEKSMKNALDNLCPACKKKYEEMIQND